jgi:PAS domain S-box-containing protein
MIGSKILIVEDEAITAMELEEMLKNRGYEVVGTAANGATAIRIAKEKWPDLILMDIRIEGKIDGIQTATQISSFHDIPIIFLTAYSDDVTLARAIKTKSHSFMLKPFNEKELYSNIELAINKHRSYQKSVVFERVMGTLFDLISDGIITTDSAGIIRRVTSNAEKFIGHKQDEITGKPLIDVVPLQLGQKDILADMIKSAVNGGETVRVKPRKLGFKSPTSGEKITVLVKMELVWLDCGEIGEMIFILSQFL